jgi:ryanodine receptor 2
MAEFEPKGIDTSSVTLSEEILHLTEALARNTHAVWAEQRLKAGWTYGPKRDDEMKQHPCLVPYDDLPEAEKEYDRATALGTLKAIVALGFRIVRLK